MPVAEVTPGDSFIVPAGERIPLDGRVVAGASTVNQAPITGESVPVEKEPGTEIFAGTINGDGTLTVEATKSAEDTTLARIIHMVEEAHARRAPAEQWVERFARIYTPTVMALALLVFLLPMEFGALTASRRAALRSLASTPMRSLRFETGPIGPSEIVQKQIA